MRVQQDICALISEVTIVKMDIIVLKQFLKWSLVRIINPKMYSLDRETILSGRIKLFPWGTQSLCFVLLAWYANH